MRAGQGDRQLDQHEGGRGDVPRAGRASACATARPWWSWPSTRQGQADTAERKVEICERAYAHPDREGRLPARGHHLRPQHLRRRHRHRGARQLRASTSSRRRGGSSRRCPTRAISGGVSNVSFSFRGNEPVRRAMHSVFLYHAIDAGMDMGIVNAGDLPVYDEIEPELREAVEDVILNRRPRRSPTERLVELAPKYKGGKGAGARSSTSPGASEPVDERLDPRPGARHHRVHRGRHRGGAPGGRAPAARHRGPADGRHERGRRPVRRGQDVPAAGGQVRARDEAGGGLPAAVHGGREGRRSRARPRARSSWPRSRATSTTSARTSSAWSCSATTTRSSTSASWSRPTASWTRRRAQGATSIGLSGLITPSLDEMVYVAARDGAARLLHARC